MKKSWADAKRFLFEDICIYSAVILLDFLLDFNLNLLAHFGIGSPHEISHPYNFGIFQFIVLVFAVIQLVRKWNEWRYYS